MVDAIEHIKVILVIALRQSLLEQKDFSNIFGEKRTEQEAVTRVATSGNHVRFSFRRLLPSSGNHSDKCLKVATRVDAVN